MASPYPQAGLLGMPMYQDLVYRPGQGLPPQIQNLLYQPDVHGKPKVQLLGGGGNVAAPSMVAPPQAKPHAARPPMPPAPQPRPSPTRKSANPSSARAMPIPRSRPLEPQGPQAALPAMAMPQAGPPAPGEAPSAPGGGFSPEINPEMGGGRADAPPVPDPPPAEGGGGWQMDPSMRGGLLAMAASLLQAKDKGQSFGGAMGEGLLNMQQAQAYMAQQDEVAKYRKAQMDQMERSAQQVDAEQAAQEQRRTQIESMISRLPTEQQDIARADPETFFKEQAQKAFSTAKPPETRTVAMGGEDVTQEFDPASGQWREIGRGARWAPQQPGQGKETWTMLSPDEVAAAGFQPGTVVTRSSTGQIQVEQNPATNRNGITIAPDGTVQIGGTGAKLSPTEIKLKDDTQTAVASGTEALKTLDRAKELNATAPDGLLAPLKQAWNYVANEKDYAAGVEYSNVVGQQALASLKDIFGGNPTEGERQILLDLQASMNKPREVRQAILERAYAAAQIRLENNKTKLNDLSTGQYGVAQPSASGTPAPPPGFEVQ